MKKRGISKAVLQKKLELLAAEIIKKAPPAGKRARREARQAEVFLLGNAEMRRLKSKYLPRKKGPANVLSFNEPAGWPNPGSGAKKLGEVYLNLGLAGGRVSGLAPLLVHGILHLLGYEHKKKSDRISMEKLEKEILKKLDISNQ